MCGRTGKQQQQKTLHTKILFLNKEKKKKEIYKGMESTFTPPHSISALGYKKKLFFLLVMNFKM